MAQRLYVALDLETTGLNVKRDTIIEIGAVLFQGTQILERFTTLVNPQRPIPHFIQQLTGIRSADVAQAPTLPEVLPELLSFVRPDVTAVIAHNVDFDLGFLKQAGINFHRPALDTFELSTILLPNMASYNLGELCLALGIHLEDAHRAQDDAEAAAQLFMELQARIHALPVQVIQQIIESGQGMDWSPLSLFELAQHQISYSQSAGRSVGRAVSSPIAPEMDLTPALYDQLNNPPSEEQPQWQCVPAEHISEIFSSNGILAQQLGDDYEEREGQRTMSVRVAEALHNGEHLLIEAGTGVGKSLAYLLPALLWSQHNGQRVVVATNTIALQDQLLHKDIPQAQALLVSMGYSPPNATLLKGRSNYLCMRRLHVWRTSHRLNKAELRVLAKVLVWQANTKTGDVSELFLPNDVESAIWRNLCSDSATCTPERCMVVHSDGQLDHGVENIRDYFWNARARADHAHLLVVNHALLLVDLVTEGDVLPPYQHLIVDEAHRMEQSATEQQTYRVHWPYVESLLRQLTMQGSLLPMLSHLKDQQTANDASLGYEELNLIHQQAVQTIGAFFHLAERVRALALEQSEIRKNVDYSQRLALDNKIRSHPLWTELEIEWETDRQELHDLILKLGALADGLTEPRQSSREPSSLYQRKLWDELLGELDSVTEALTELMDWLEQIIGPSSGMNHAELVTWLEIENIDRYREHQEQMSVRLLCAPLHVSDHLEKALVRQQRAAIFTGATLRTGSGFDFIQERLGLWHAKTATVSSPFDYKKSTMLYMPDGMPEPNHPHYQQSVEQAIIDAATTLGGRTMALFTSYAHLRATADAIRAPLNQMGINVLQHGTSSRMRLLREYTESGRSVLLGTRSFWEGIDLPGDQLLCLFIARLPFSVPTDPLVAARSAEFDDPFNEYTLPESVLRFRQGFGRLIRRTSDRGTVVLLDSRIWRRSYGQTFLDALPACTVRHAPLSNLGTEIVDWLGPENIPPIGPNI